MKIGLYCKNFVYIINLHDISQALAIKALKIKHDDTRLLGFKLSKCKLD